MQRVEECVLAKADSPRELVRDVIALEARADRCLENLDIYGLSRGLAVWACRPSLWISWSQIGASTATSGSTLLY